MRVIIENKNQMAFVFGTVIEKIWGGKWQILFQNDHYIRLHPKDFEVVCSDTTQKQLDVSTNNEISLVTPIEKHVSDVHNKNIRKHIEGTNLKGQICEEKV